jgi:sugar lactone lactonase YvrE
MKKQYQANLKYILVLMVLCSYPYGAASGHELVREGPGADSGIDDPTDVAVNYHTVASNAIADGFILVADTGNHRIQAIDVVGGGGNSFVFGQQGNGNGQFQTPQGVTVNDNGEIFIADTGNHRIQVFNQIADDVATGFERLFPEPQHGYTLNNPRGLGRDAENRIYIADAGDQRVYVVNASGFLLGSIGMPGNGKGELLEPIDVAVMPAQAPFPGRVYVLDRNRNLINVYAPFDDGGAYLFAFGSSGSATGQFSSAGGIAIDGSGHIYVADSGNQRVQVFEPNGSLLDTIAPGTGQAAGVAANESHAAIGVYVSDANHQSLREYDWINLIDLGEQGLPLDSDGDRLLDSWEINGFDYGHDGIVDVNLPALGAHPQHKDIFVECDYLTDNLHSHGPIQNGIADIVTAFAAAPVANPDGSSGVQLHVDLGPLYGAGVIAVNGASVTGTYGNLGGGNAIPEAGNEIIDWDGAAGLPASSVFVLRAANFDEMRKNLFHYCIFGHDTNFRKAVGDTTSGWARGSDFIVTLGEWSSSVGTQEQQAGTFMHELGHVIGLNHGGGDGTNKKPNYLSVMNYSFQMCKVPGSTAAQGLFPGVCTYSRIRLPPIPPTAGALDETDLDECLGIDNGLGYFGAMDWNVNLLLEGASGCSNQQYNVQEDINNDGENTGLLAGHDDWSNLRYRFTAAEGSGTVYPEDDPLEADIDAISNAQADLSNRLHPEISVDAVTPATAVPGETVTLNVTFSNHGSGPALTSTATLTSPYGGEQVFDLDVLAVEDQEIRNLDFAIPADACPDVVSSNATLAYTDFGGLEGMAAGSADLQILDVTPPELSVTLSPNRLSTNHKLEKINAEIVVTDNCDPNPTVRLLSITSNQPDNATGDGNTDGDIKNADFGSDDRSFSLRRERQGSNDRIYTVIYQAKDASGNTTEEQATVTVTLP